MRSKHHNINPPMANLSHIVNSMSFGPSLSRREERLINVVPEELFSPKHINPMDSNIYINRQLHQAYHHYIKVCTAMQLSVSVDIPSPGHAHDFMDVLRWCLPM